MNQPDNTPNTEDMTVPKEGQRRVLSGDNQSSRCPFLGDELSDQAVVALRDVAAILATVHQRLIREGIDVPNLNYENAEKQY